MVAGTAVVALWWFPDAISQLRTMNTPYAEAARDCDLSHGPCTATFADGVVVHLVATPQPVGPDEPVIVDVTVEGHAKPRSIELQGADMAMGFVSLALTERDGRWTATVPLPACTTDRMEWKADIVLEDRVAGFFLWSTRQ